MFEELFLKSMVKGIGKATGTMIVVGIVGGGIWYATLPKKITKTKKRVKETKETQTVQMESIETMENNKEDHIEHVDIDNVLSMPQHFLESENRYRNIFDKLRS